MLGRVPAVNAFYAFLTRKSHRLAIFLVIFTQLFLDPADGGFNRTPPLPGYGPEESLYGHRNSIRSDTQMCLLTHNLSKQAKKLCNLTYCIIGTNHQCTCVTFQTTEWLIRWRELLKQIGLTNSTHISDVWPVAGVRTKQALQCLMVRTSLQLETASSLTIEHHTAQADVYHLV